MTLVLAELLVFSVTQNNSLHRDTLRVPVNTDVRAEAARGGAADEPHDAR